MSRTRRRPPTKYLMSEEEYNKIMETPWRYSWKSSNPTYKAYVARYYADQNAGRLNASGWFRRALNRLHRAKANQQVRSTLAQNKSFDDISVIKEKRDANWLWF